ncbi:AlpA family phage regulatory protein [Enterobacter sp. HK169]|uniref:helix-turn-helix transcriptional regulator n=1 Tax=Enterobacteriaceae TaxID=543 RepID=UPI001FCC2BD0|nr:AlpA family phage regulatory protein [Atlantibacter subterranea]
MKVNTTISDRGLLLRQQQQLIRINKMLQLLDCSRTTLYRWVKAGIFPQPIIRGGRTLGWPEQVYQEWLKEQ